MIIRASLIVETIVKSYMYIRMMTGLTSFTYSEMFYHEWGQKVFCYTKLLEDWPCFILQFGEFLDRWAFFGVIAKICHMM